jgi:hypothetical protein
MPKIPPELSRQDRAKVRVVARDEYLRRRGDLEQMLVRLRERVAKGFGKELRSDAEAHACELFNYWYGTDIDEPSVIAVIGEPRANCEDKPRNVLERAKDQLERRRSSE